MSDALGLNEIQSPEGDGDCGDFDLKGSFMSLNDLGRPNSLSWHGGVSRKYRWISRSCRSLQVAGPPLPPISHPFSGTLTSQLRCTECGYKVSLFKIYRSCN